MVLKQQASRLNHGLATSLVSQILDGTEDLVQECISGEQGKSGIVARWRGNGIIPTNFCITMYHGRSGTTLVPSDMVTMMQLLHGENLYRSSLPVIQIDDSGWGCPVGGVLIGAYGFGYYTSIYLKPETFWKNKEEYKKDLCQAGLDAVGLVLIKARPLSCTLLDKQETMIEVCTSSVLACLRDTLADQGWNVRSAKIQGHLQDKLKVAFRDRLVQLGVPVELVNANYPRITAYMKSHGAPDGAFKW